MEQHGNMLAIAGSPGSGKTSLAVKLAAEIAGKRKNVVLVCSDPFVPSIPFLLPMDTEQEVSLGALLTAPLSSFFELYLLTDITFSSPV